MRLTATLSLLQELYRERLALFDRHIKGAQAIAEFERYGDTRLVLADPALAGLRLSGSFGQREIRAFRTALLQVLPVRLSPRTDGAYDVVRAP